MTAGLTARSRPWPLVTSLGAHILVFPWWALVSAFPILDRMSAAHPPDVVMTGLAIGWLSAGLAGWGWILYKIVQWSREARRSIWVYPFVYAFLVSFSVLFALALLVPRVRRVLTPEPASGVWAQH